jgi:hypothetical protein
MASKSLLRYIFRHGPQSKARSVTTPPRANSYEPKEVSPRSSGEATPYQQSTTSNHAPESPLAYKIRSDSRASSNLEDIAEESSSDDDKSSSTETISPLEHDLQALGTRDLMTATLYEAKIATHAHMDTIDASLNLLDALDGFSATITVMREDFLDRKEMCEEKLVMLEDVERAVERMRFAGDDNEQKR